MFILLLEYAIPPLLPVTEKKLIRIFILFFGVTRLERPKGVKDKVKEARRAQSRFGSGGRGPGLGVRHRGSGVGGPRPGVGVRAPSSDLLLSKSENLKC